MLDARAMRFAHGQKGNMIEQSHGLLALCVPGITCASLNTILPASALRFAVYTFAPVLCLVG
jgi:hypothetical protein